jgi:TP901 family phage tail tape measure protein
MTDATIKSTVGIQMSPEGMASAAKQLDGILQRTIANLNTAAKTAEKAIDSSGKAGQVATNQINGQLKALAITLSQIKTLQNTLQSTGASGGLNAARLLGDFSSSGRVGKQARELADYTNSLRGASSAMTTLKDRARQFDVQAGNLAKNGQLLSNSQIMKAEKIEATAKAYSKISNEIGSIRARVALLSTDGQKAFKPLLDNLQQLEKVNAKAFSNRRRSEYGPELATTRDAVRGLQERLIAREKLEAKTRLNVEALRKEGIELTRLTTLEREAALAAKVRSANSRFNNAQLTGTIISRRDTDQVSRFTRAAALAATTQNQLVSALNKPNVSAERLQTLINRHKTLQREIAESIAQQNRMGGDPKGGFFAGIKSSASNLLGGGEGGFGAGALLGRVGAYAGAAAVVYGLISALQQAVSFSIQFEDSLAQLQAISGSTNYEMRDLSQSIFAVAKNSADSVLEITKSATAIAQAGYKGKELSQVLSASVNLSAASGASPADSVDILTSALGSFQLAGTEATRVADAFVAALNNSKLGVAQIQAGIQYVGSTANQLDISLNELAGTLAVIADTGIRGTTGPTGLRQLLVDLVDPSEKVKEELKQVGLTVADIDVKVLGFSEVLKRLNNAGFDPFAAGIEVRAANVYNAIAGSTDEILKQTQATLDQGAAQEAAQVRTESVSATWQKMINTVSELAASIGNDLAPVLKFLIDLLGVAATVGLGLIKVLSSTVNFVVTLGGTFDKTGVSGEALNSKLQDLGYTADQVNLSHKQLTGGLEDVQSALKASEAETDSLKAQQLSLAQETEKLMVRQDSLVGKNGDLTETTSEVRVAVEELSLRFPGLREEFDKTEGGVQGLLKAFEALDEQIQRTMVNAARTQKITAEAARDVALEKLEDDTSFYKNLGPNGWIYRDVGLKEYGDPRRRGGLGTPLNTSQQKESFNIESLLKAGDPDSIRKARNLIQDSKDTLIKAIYGELLVKINTSISDYDSAILKSKEADELLGGYAAAQSEVGKKIRTARRANSTATVTASSQGAAGGRSTAQILLELQQEVGQLKRRLSETKDPEEIKLLDRALIGAKADIAKLSRNPNNPNNPNKPKRGEQQYTGQARKDAEYLENWVRAQGFRVGERGSQDPIHKGAGHREWRAIDVNLASGEGERLDPKLRLRMNELARSIQAKGGVVLWNGERYDPSGAITRIKGSRKAKHYTHLHGEVPLGGLFSDGKPNDAEYQSSVNEAEKKALKEQEERIKKQLAEAESLRKTRGKIEIEAIEEEISTIMRNAKTGSFSREDLNTKLETAMVLKYMAVMNQFDLENSKEGLGPEGLKEWELKRNAQINLFEKQSLDEFAKLYGYIADSFSKSMELYEQVIKSNLDKAERAAQEKFKRYEEKERSYNLPSNRGRDFGAGDEYLLGERRRQAEILRDQEIVAAQDVSNGSLYNANERRKDNYKNTFGREFQEYKPGSTEMEKFFSTAGEEEAAAWKEIQSALDAYNVTLAETAELQQLIDERTGKVSASQFTFKQRIDGAAKAWLDQSGAMDTWEKTAQNSVAPLLDTITNGLTDMFKGLITGQQSLKQSLKAMLSSIADFVAQMIAKALALAAVKWFLQMIGLDVSGLGGAGGGGFGGEGGSGAGGLLGQILSPGGGIGGGLWRGGEVKSYARGGQITSGLATRDSTLIHAAKGEYVLRNSAVDSIGTDMLDAMNSRGAAAIASAGSNIIPLPTSAPVETNVYVIAPEEKPTLGPNDVIAIISKDVLQGGQTKRLIKKVANG